VGDDAFEMSSGANGNVLPFNWKKLTLQFALGLLALIAALGLLGYFFKEPLFTVSRWFVDTFGPFGVALGFFIGDVFPNIAPHDAFLMFALIGGLPFWTITLYAYAGSIAGISICYFIGRAMRQTRWLTNFLTKSGLRNHERANRFGLTLLVLGALTPLRFTVGGLACGAVEVPFWKFFLVAQVRILRVVGTLWLIKVGVMNLVQ